MTKSRWILICLVVCGLRPLHESHLKAEEWNRFRGPNGTGVCTQSPLPDAIDVERNLRWEIASDKGTSSVVVSGERLFFTSYEDVHRALWCCQIDTGKTLWRREVDKLRDENGTPPNGPATSTPACSGERVVVLFPDAGLFCYDLHGSLQWKRDIGPFHSMHGMATSPLIVGDRVIVVADQLRQSWIAGFDLRTGGNVWKQDRVDGVTGGYSTPGVIRHGEDHAAVVASGPTGLFAYRSSDGHPLWSVAGICNAPVTVPLIGENRAWVCEPVGEPTPMSQLASLDKNKDGRFQLDEVKDNLAIYRLLARMDERWGNQDNEVDESEWNRAFGTMLNKGGLVAVDLTQTGAKVAWSYQKKVPYVASPVLFDGLIYFVQDGGILTTVDAASGEMVQRGRLPKGGRKFYASLVAGDGKVYAVDTDGTVSIIRAGRKWSVLHTAELGEPCFATPALAAGRLFIRSASRLYCFGP